MVSASVSGPGYEGNVQMTVLALNRRVGHSYHEVTSAQPSKL